MLPAFELFWGVTALELILWVIPRLQWRRYAAPFVVVILLVASTGILVAHPSVLGTLILLASIYRILNLLRLVKARINEKYLLRVTTQTSVWLIGLQSFFLLLWELWVWLQVSTYRLWLILVYGILLGSLVLLSSTIRHMRTTRAPELSASGFASRDLPTLTVAVPARNETDDLQACLESLVASDYPKLEILVLDDCSQNPRTPEIIRRFAHGGVRFVQGRVPENNWLAKNQAYQQLFEEANGDFILFAGVDLRFESDSLRHLVTAMLAKNKSMISVIPRNILRPVFSGHSSVLIQSMRYAWEFVLPRKLFRRPPVLSTCWIVKREIIRHAGGLAAVSRSIVPESYFARVSVVHDGYSFMQSSDSMGIMSRKSFEEQWLTAVRTRYPQVHRRVELVLVLTLGELIGVLLPFGLLIAAMFGKLSLQLTLVSMIAVLILVYVYTNVVFITYRTWLLRSVILLPVAILLDVFLLNYSMVRYEFFEVIWKGRNVCIPVMRVIDRLPQID